MTRPLGIFAASLSALALLIVTARTARTQIAVVPPFVQVQNATPGTPQAGHSNITGTAIAGQFVGGGAGLSNVNADKLDGLDSTAFLQGVPNPLSLSGAQLTPIITATNSSVTSNATGVRGVSTAATGATNGLWGTNSSASGRGVFGEATATTGLNYGGRFESAGTTGRGVYGLASATTGSAYGVFGQSQSSTGRGVYGSASAATGTNYGGYFDSNSVDGYGVFANSAGTYGLFAQTTATSGAAYGVYGKSSAFNGVGVFGEATSATGTNYGGRFWASSTAGIGVSAAALSTTGSTFGGRFENNSTSGRGLFAWATATSGSTYGVWGRADSPTGVGGYFQADKGEGLRVFSDGAVGATFTATNVLFSGTAIDVQGASYGGKFASNGTGVYSRAPYAIDGNAGSDVGGVGVRGFAGAADGLGVQGTGTDAGVAGWSSSFRGVWGDAFNNSSNTHYAVYGEARSPNGRGVYGLFSSTSGSGYGVRGVNSNAGYAVYAAGDLGASGTKSFVIDHPFDPLNKVLKHYCAEGPEPKNVYDGTVTTDGNGWATVVLPNYFTEINKDPRVQLTVNDSSEDFVMVKMVGEFTGHTFRLRTSKGRVKVYWEVKATRNDAWVRAHGAPVEVMKDPSEQGKYQHPELYGKPRELAVDYDPRAEAAKVRQAKLNARR